MGTLYVGNTKLILYGDSGNDLTQFFHEVSLAPSRSGEDIVLMLSYHNKSVDEIKRLVIFSIGFEELAFVYTECF